MAITVKSITLWRREIEHRPGALAETLAPLADSGINLQVLMAYRFPGNEERGAVELFPVSGKRATAAAERGGFMAYGIPALLVEGNDAPGLGARMCRAIADAGINMAFVVAQVMGKKFSAVFGFDDQEGARSATSLVKMAAATPRRRTSSRRKHR
ncbi:MAG: hypothetical protein WBC51_13830 [Vicinamibacterales bacterium]